MRDTLWEWKLQDVGDVFGNQHHRSGGRTEACWRTHEDGPPSIRCFGEEPVSHGLGHLGCYDVME